MKRYNLIMLIFLNLFIILFSSDISAKVRIIEYPIPTPNSRPLNIALDNKGRVWFTELDGKKIGVFNPSKKTFTEYPVTFRPRDIAYNVLNRRVYFTEDEYSNGHYGVLNPRNGRLSEFATGLPVASAAYCTITPDRKFWFNGWDSRTVSQADHLGQITSYIPPSFGYMSGLAEDPDGNIWLTIVGAYESNPRLLKLDTGLAQPGTSNGFTEIPLSASQATIRFPVAALGKIWFAIQDTSKIGSYDPATNLFQEYSTPTPNASVANLAADRWGRIWFTEPLANQIGMLNLRTGVITEFPVPTPGSSPDGIAVDMNRDIVWFTENSGNKIGKLVLR